MFTFTYTIAEWRRIQQATKNRAVSWHIHEMFINTSTRNTDPNEERTIRLDGTGWIPAYSFAHTFAAEMARLTA